MFIDFWSGIMQSLYLWHYYLSLSTLSDINIATPFLFMFLCSIIFYLFLYLKCTSYIAGFCFLNQSDNLCLLINMFRSFTSYIIQILWHFQHSWVYLYFLATWFLFIPCRVFLIASFSFFLAFFWVNWIFVKDSILSPQLGLLMSFTLLEIV